MLKGVSQASSTEAKDITVGTTTITSGTNGRVLYDNAGVLGEKTVTGTGSVVLATSPALTTPDLGTPTAVVLSAATGLPISTGVSGLGSGVATFMATPTSANLATALTDETGSGSAVFSTSPTLVTPALGVATATSINFGGSTLNIYVTGTFVPTVVSSGGGTPTYALQVGNYTQIGNRVLYNIRVTLATLGTLASGSITVAGLPVSADTSTQHNQVQSAFINGVAVGVTSPAIAQITAGVPTSLVLLKYTTGNVAVLAQSDLTASTDFLLSGQYQTV